MKCSECGKIFDSLTYLTEYGLVRLGSKDTKGYCIEDFEKKFSRLHERTENEKSDN